MPEQMIHPASQAVAKASNGIEQASSIEFSESRLALPRYSLGEEIANAITHGVGVLLSVAGLTMLLVLAVLFGDGWHVASAIVYGVSLILLYSASTLYHAIQTPRLKAILRVVDHSSIYLLIAGTYTPFTLVSLADNGGMILCGIVWGIAALGIVIEAFWIHRPRWLLLLGYFAMGWLIIVKVNPLLDNLGSAGLWLLVIGGLVYMVGTVFYMLKNIPYMHAVWHVFVLAGSVIHFLAVKLYIIPSLVDV